MAGSVRGECVGGEETEGASGFGCSTVFQQLHSRHLVALAVGRCLEKVALESKALDSSLQRFRSSDDPLDRTGMCEPGPPPLECPRKVLSADLELLEHCVISASTHGTRSRQSVFPAQVCLTSVLSAAQFLCVCGRKGDSRFERETRPAR